MENNQLSDLLAFIETRQWDKAWPEFERLLEQGPPTARLLLLGSHAAYGRRDFFRSRQLAEKALSTWNSVDPGNLLGQVRFQLGMVARMIGDSHVALEQFQLFLSELSSKYADLSMGEGKAYFYLGLTLRERRDLTGAVEAYQKANSCFRRDGLPSLLCKCLHNQAWLYCHMNRQQDARACLMESSTLISTPAEQVHQTLCEAFLAAVEERYDLANHLCEEIFRRAERGEPITAEEQCLATWVAGTVALSQGNLENASALANIALNFATEAKDSRLMNDAGALRRSVLVRQQAGA